MNALLITQELLALALRANQLSGVLAKAAAENRDVTNEERDAAGVAADGSIDALEAAKKP